MRQYLFLKLLIPVATTLLCVSAIQAPAQETPFEKSGGQITPRFDETILWLQDLADRSPLLHSTSFGTSGQGRQLPLIIADKNQNFTAPESDRPVDKLVVLIQACIHAGESCGKDAGMILLRDIARTNDQDGLLDNITLLFIPIFNVDGHERFGPYNRINQNGPQEMGWRVTSRNQNLNRDFLKADTVEMQAWLTLFNKWSPDFLIDIHSTDGADYQYALTYGLETNGNMEANLTTWLTEYRDKMLDQMAADNFPMAPYVSFKERHDPRSGLVTWTAGPRFSQGYTAIRNRPGLLIETHMMKDYSIRVAATNALVINSLKWLNEQASKLRQEIIKADDFTASPAFRSLPFPVRFKASDTPGDFEYLGVEYEKVTSEITGGQWVRFGNKPETTTIPIYNDVHPSLSILLPEAYIIPPQWTETIDRLSFHGVKISRLSEPAEIDIRTYRFKNPQWRQRPYEGHHTVTFETETINETRVFPAGSVVVDMNQVTAKIVAHLLEPKAPDSLVRWDYFDAIFERVEYVESYVIEDLIRVMVADNPDLLIQLEEKKSADPEFAANPWAIRYWFYEQTPYYDKRVNIYPVGLLDNRDILEKLKFVDN